MPARRRLARRRSRTPSRAFVWSPRMTMADERFPKSLRLRRSADYRRVQRSGRRIRSPHLVVLYKQGPGEGARFGMAVSRKVGNAVVRNRVKRCLREAIRRQHTGVSGVDVVFIARTAAAAATYEVLRDEVARAFERICRRTS